MTSTATMSASDLYTRIADTFVTDPTLEGALLADFEAAVHERFGVKLPKPARLSRTPTGFCLTYDGKDYDLGDPRHQTQGELNDAELELVSGGGGCENGGVELDDNGNVINPGSEGGNRRR